MTDQLGGTNESMVNNVKTGFNDPCVFGLYSWFDALVTYRSALADVSYWKRNRIHCAMFHSDLNTISSSCLGLFQRNSAIFHSRPVQKHRS